MSPVRPTTVLEEEGAVAGTEIPEDDDDDEVEIGPMQWLAT